MQIDEQRLQQQDRRMQQRVPVAVWMAVHMPAAAFAGLRIESISTDETVVSVPGGRRTQNPFRTMYRAVQGMAAEPATGIVPACVSRSASMKLRMSVVGTEGTFIKRAPGCCRFTCTDAHRVIDAFEDSLKTGQSIDCALTATGQDGDNQVVSEWVFRWNFPATESE